MNHRRLRSRFMAAATVSVAATTAVLTLGVGAASAGSGPYSVTTAVGPRWNIGHVEQIRSAGSDTTFFLSQTLGNYFAQSGLYGCNLDGAAVPNFSTCVNAPGDLSATTDTVDNYDHIEVVTGLGKIGSGDGQKQLCGVESATFPVDFARSSKPPSSSNGCSTMIGLGFGKDGVPSVDFPGAEGPGTAVGATTPWHAVSGGIVGPVAAGWLPGDAVTCDTGTPNTSTNTQNRTTNPNVGILANSCSGVPLENVSNNDNGGGTSSTAYRIWCDTSGTRITDWGQLTNLTALQTVGQGTAIGVPITVVGVNAGSGTTGVFAGFVNSGSGSGPCSGSSGNPNANAFNPGGGYAPETAVLENNAAQLGDFAAADFTGADVTQAADQAALTATSLYFTSNGVYNSNIHARIVTLVGGTQYAANKMLENDVIPTTTQSGTLMQNTYPTARTLFNVYRTDTVRGSTADYLNWICDANNNFNKGTDLYTGKNYDTEITSAINTTYGFIRLTDLTGTPNNSCQMITSVATPGS